MSLEEIEKKAIATYNKNLEFIKKQNKELFENIKLFEEAVSNDLIKEQYSLEYKDSYFDVFDHQNNSWVYNQDSNKYSSNIIDNVNFETFKNSFKTFYEVNYTDDVVENAKKASILSQTIFGIAPITNYVHKNLDKKQEMKDILKFFIFGVGLGIHIPKIHEKIKSKVYLIVEPSLELFRLSLFVTDYTLLKNTKLHFAVSMTEEKFRELVYILSEQTFVYDYYIKFFMFSNNCNMYIDIIQNSLVSQRHILYAYNRGLESLQRTYKYMYERFKFISLSEDVKKDILKKPVIILAMGPSLQKDINFVKENQDKFIIVAIYATLPLLEENNIIPDIITQYDQQDSIVMSTLEKVKNKSFFDNTIFLFASHLDEKLMDSFPKENIFVYNGVYESRKDFLSLTAPSVGEISYALTLMLGAKDIYLLGLDMALGDDGESHSGDHEGARAFDDVEERSNENFNFRKNILKVKGNFREIVNTLPVFKSSINQMNTFSKNFKSIDVNVYNLSDGALFENIKPLTIGFINQESLVSFDKKSQLNLIKNCLDNIAISDIREEDILFNSEKYEDAIVLLRFLEEFHSQRKYSNVMEYKNAIFMLFEKVIYKDLKCKDLQEILLNFYKYTLPPIFHLYNMKKLDNPKKHIKQLNKVLYIQSKKIVDLYLDILKDDSL